MCKICCYCLFHLTVFTAHATHYFCPLLVFKLASNFSLSGKYAVIIRLPVPSSEATTWIIFPLAACPNIKQLGKGKLSLLHFLAYSILLKLQYQSIFNLPYKFHQIALLTWPPLVNYFLYIFIFPIFS